MSIVAFPKIFPIGQDYISRLFDGPVEITEKIDGSQFAFCLTKDEGLIMRSKGTLIHDFEARAEGGDLFSPVIRHVLDLYHQDNIPPEMVFYGETLKKPKHNTLTYERTPKNHFALFAASVYGSASFIQTHDLLVGLSKHLDCDTVPLLYYGEIRQAEELKQFLNQPSYLGGTNAEGIVAKNYRQPFLLGGQPISVMAGKYVTEALKEVHHEGGSKKNTGAGKWQTFTEGYRTEARWQKAVQHLAESGQLTNSPKDIGNLIKEVRNDIQEEAKEIIKAFLWREFGGDVLRYATKGLPEWYRQQLLEGAFDGTDNS